MTGKIEIDCAAIQAGLDAGMSWAQIGQQYGCSGKTVQRRAADCPDLVVPDEAARREMAAKAQAANAIKWENRRKDEIDRLGVLMSQARVKTAEVLSRVEEPVKITETIEADTGEVIRTIETSRGTEALDFQRMAQGYRILTDAMNRLSNGLGDPLDADEGSSNLDAEIAALLEQADLLDQALARDPVTAGEGGAAERRTGDDDRQ